MFNSKDVHTKKDNGNYLLVSAPKKINLTVILFFFLDKMWLFFTVITGTNTARTTQSVTQQFFFFY